MQGKYGISIVDFVVQNKKVKIRGGLLKGTQYWLPLVDSRHRKVFSFGKNKVKTILNTLKILSLDSWIHLCSHLYKCYFI